MSHRLTYAASAGTFAVDGDKTGNRCPNCGTRYAQPWADPELISSPIPAEDHARAAPAVEPIAAAGCGQEDISLTISVDGP